VVVQEVHGRMEINKWDIIVWVPFIILYVVWCVWSKPRIGIVILTIVLCFIFSFVIPKWIDFTIKKKNEETKGESIK